MVVAAFVMVHFSIPGPEQFFGQLGQHFVDGSLEFVRAKLRGDWGLLAGGAYKIRLRYRIP